MPTPSLLQRLKERKLVQWALAYLAGAFVVFQGVEVMAEPWGISPGVQRGIHILLLFGLFITLVLAWYHGEKGRQRVSGPEVLMVAALLTVAGFAVSSLGGWEEGATASSSREGDDRPGIAVLPCTNVSPEPDDAYLAGGLHEEILVRLQGISSLFSIGGTSVQQYAQDPPSTDVIAASLGVGFVGECSVRKALDKVRITFQLLDGMTGGQLWAENYDRDFTPGSIFEIQSDIAEQVANAVGAVVTPQERERNEAVPTDNSEALAALHSGRFYLRSGIDEPNFRRAIQFFKTALDADSLFAHAYSALGEAYAGLVMSNIDPPDEAWPFAREASLKALEIDENLAAPHRVLAQEKMFFEYDWEGAEEALLRSLEINPDQADTRLYFAYLLAVLQRGDEGLVHLREARRLEPNAPLFDLFSCWAFLMLDRLDEAQALAERLIGSDPPFPLGNLCLAQTFLEGGELEAALPPLHAAIIAMGPDIADEVAWLSMTYGLLGREEEARQYADQLERMSAEGDFVSPVNRAWVSIGFGDIDRAIQLFEEGLERRDPYLFFSASARFMALGLSDDPRFRAIRRRMGLGQEQDQP